ncbi:MAG: TrkA family potassium uptake protein [Planctomycetaceae bacterium]
MRRAFVIVGLLLSLTFAGTVGFHYTAGQPWLEAAYMAVITLTTVGSRDSGRTPAAMIFTMVYLVCGLSIFTYSAFTLGQFFVNVEFRKMLERRRMERDIRKLSDHYIVCGMGRMGSTICEFLAKRRKPFVLVDSDTEKVAEVSRERGWYAVEGDATDDGVLLTAGIERARGLATVLATDADNVYVVLTARMLSSDLQIVARASDDKAVQKLQRAGSTRVISPFSSGAVKMARFMLSPSVEDFLEITDSGGGELELADIQIGADSPYVGRKLMDTDLRDKGVMIIGIRRASGERLLPPSGSAVIEVGDSLFAFGSSEAVNSMIGPSGGG